MDDTFISQLVDIRKSEYAYPDKSFYLVVLAFENHQYCVLPYEFSESGAIDAENNYKHMIGKLCRVTRHKHRGYWTLEGLEVLPENFVPFKFLQALKEES